jgi:hypothetical protein
MVLRRTLVGSFVSAVALLVLLGSHGVLATTAPVRQVPAATAAPASKLTLEQQEAFLKSAKVVRTRSASKGVTGTLRATLSDGTLTHDASIQQVDVTMQEFKSNRGVEFNFRDSWRYNVAAYRIDRVLDLGMTPPSVERSYEGKTGAFTWWVDDVLMDEGERLKTKATAPKTALWNEQMWHVRLFDQLIYNVDRNLGNLLIDQQWKVWMIDHSRAFRLMEKVKTPGNLSRVDRRVFERLKALDQATLKKAVEDYLTGSEIKSLLLRRSEIVALMEKAGPTALIDRAYQ